MHIYNWSVRQVTDCICMCRIVCHCTLWVFTPRKCLGWFDVTEWHFLLYLFCLQKIKSYFGCAFYRWSYWSCHLQNLQVGSL